MEPEARSVASADGTHIAYDISGAGPPLVLVSGAFIDRSTPRQAELADLLARQFTVLNYDRRGRGDSTDATPYAVEREIEDLTALGGVCDGVPAIMGLSSGAVLALRAVRAGVPARAVALYEPPFLVDASREPPAADLGARVQALVDADDRSGAAKLYLTEAIGAPSLFVTFMRMTPVWKRLAALAHTLPYDWQIMGDTVYGRPLSFDDWGEIPVRTLAMAGSKSPAQLRSAAKAIASILPDAEHLELDGENHNPDPQALAPVVDEFLTGRRVESEMTV